VNTQRLRVGTNPPPAASAAPPRQTAARSPSAA
jgi:hypothetical protein